MRLLLIEDNESDVFFFREALGESGTEIDLEVCSRGDIALEYLEQAEGAGHLPELIALDLNLPRYSGLEILERLRARPSWAAIPTVILSSSSAESDVQGAYGRGARAYLVKPMDYDQLAEMVAALIGFWKHVRR